MRVSAFVRWPEVIKAGSIAGDMIHVSDLYTTIARITGTSGHIPRDRIVDGLDQWPRSFMILLPVIPMATEPYS